jgi:hypothetical protein
VFRDINSPLSKKSLDLHDSPSAFYSPSKHTNGKVVTQLASPSFRSLSFNSHINKSDSPQSSPSNNPLNIGLKFDLMKFAQSDNRDKNVFQSPLKKSEDTVLAGTNVVSRRERLLKKLNISK